MVLRVIFNKEDNGFIMLKVSKYLILCCCLFSFVRSKAQNTIQIEVAPFLVPCVENKNEECLQLLGSDGSNLKVIPLEGIEGFIPEKGYEYTLNVQEIEANSTTTEIKKYILLSEVSKMWVPQFAIDAPLLDGSFQVVGFGGKSIDTNDLNLIINANNSIMSGSTGCNNYHLFFKQLGYTLIFSKILSTHLYCASRSTLEEEYFVIFNSVHHFELNDDVLKLYDISDRQLLEAARIQ